MGRRSWLASILLPVECAYPLIIESFIFTKELPHFSHQDIYILELATIYFNVINEL